MPNLFEIRWKMWLCTRNRHRHTDTHTSWLKNKLKIQQG